MEWGKIFERGAYAPLRHLLKGSFSVRIGKIKTKPSLESLSSLLSKREMRKKRVKERRSLQVYL